ncbi:hypothetical protein ORI20_32770 [Mycobacterium sp. CVI_P3]|uniref:Uncharacterized protein n=1 Tax=Mycobacterium pinniadriaticum TaxID=2994102 RepID=A0ABT3SPR7_9MYCO|nr:hypothetical protein [Mycobacterium pinniadriaticum]MCX2935031.1 hypothetical protein [Mycobacterium pinniadriaticum]MCX2941453.1 hypothetical protein [Mycobacterium pinniadriaticum]
MSKYQCSNDTGLDLVIVEVGVVKAAGTIEADVPIEIPNLTLVDTAKKKVVNKGVPYSPAGAMV